jgi:hypothetical protein
MMLLLPLFRLKDERGDVYLTSGEKVFSRRVAAEASGPLAWTITAHLRCHWCTLSWAATRM